MNRLFGRLALGVALCCLFSGFGVPVSHAATVGGETWSSALRVQTVAQEIDQNRWKLEIRVYRLTGDTPILSKSVETFTGRAKSVTIQGLDQREYRFNITVRKNALETRLEIRENGEPTEYVRATYETDLRQELIASSESNVLRVGGRVLAPELVRRVEPRYPEEAKAYRVSGVVILEATIDEAGAVTRTRVVKGLPFGLSEAATEAVANWRFRPATMDGKPVAVAYNVSVEFNLHRSGD